jgi:hypothetical protein
MKTKYGLLLAGIGSIMYFPRERRGLRDGTTYDLHKLGPVTWE